MFCSYDFNDILCFLFSFKFTVVICFILSLALCIISVIFLKLVPLFCICTVKDSFLFLFFFLILLVLVFPFILFLTFLENICASIHKKSGENDLKEAFIFLLSKTFRKILCFNKVHKTRHKKEKGKKDEEELF